jgi:diadenosine tetraphosphate (Ap4A) HIT family hydrolase
MSRPYAAAVVLALSNRCRDTAPQNRLKRELMRQSWGMRADERPSEYHRRLPYGERVAADPVLGGPFFPFDGDIQVRPLDEPVLPEPPRRGEPGGDPCPTCAEPGSGPNVIWRDEQWSLLSGMEPNGLPMVALLVTREHYLLDTLPPELMATLGPMIQRVAGAIRRIDGVGRTHFSRWGDGSEHFHIWFLARPLGMMQLRGAMLAVWDDLLPRVPDEEFRTNARTVAAALAETGGEPVGAGLP